MANIIRPNYLETGFYFIIFDKTSSHALLQTFKTNDGPGGPESNH